jgi:hypothetical protein
MTWLVLRGVERDLKGGQSMSTSLLHQTLNIVGYRQRRTEYVGREIRFTVEQDPTTLGCPGCGSPNGQGDTANESPPTFLSTFQDSRKSRSSVILKKKFHPELSTQPGGIPS